jgi:hypothetical protein
MIPLSVCNLSSYQAKILAIFKTDSILGYFREFALVKSDMSYKENIDIILN